MKQFAVFFGASVLLLLTAGCFVIDGYKVSRPYEMAHRGRQHEGFSPEYHRTMLYSDFTLDVSVSNYDNLWEMWFFLNIFPQLDQFHANSEPLRVHVTIAPTAGNKDVCFDPWRARIKTEKETNIAPKSISCFSENHPRKPDFPVSVTEPLDFLIAFPVTKDSPLSVSVPYQLLVQGITVSGDPATVGPIQFEPKIIVRPGFRLPY